jgi:hypothetical protein
METAAPRPSFSQLVELVDRMLDDCDEDTECLALRLGHLEPEVRSELFVSDLLNAWQVFYFCFRTEPDLLTRERMELEPASSLSNGLKIEATDLLEMYFAIREAVPIIVIHDGDKIVATFTGKSAYGQGREIMQKPEYL